MLAWSGSTSKPTGRQLRPNDPQTWIWDSLLDRWRKEAESQVKIVFNGTGTPRDKGLAQLKRELAQVRKERVFSRRGYVGCQRISLRYQVIERNRHVFAIRRMYRCVWVSAIVSTSRESMCPVPASLT